MKFKQNGIVSVFKSKSSTTIDKRDITETLLLKAIKESLKEFNLRTNANTAEGNESEVKMIVT